MKDRLFVDMDGTLAVFKVVDTLETLYEQGYFLNLSPQMNVVDSVRYIMEKHKDDIEVFIMSAVLTDSKYALEEKNAWIDKYIPGINQDHRIFPPCGADKKEYIPGGVRESDYLMDDYTHNLTLWQPPAKGIKILNGINDTHGTWTGDKLDYRKRGEQLAKDIVSIMQNGAVIRDNIHKNEIVRFSVDLNELRKFAEHNLQMLKNGNWNSFKGTEFNDGDPVEADVENAILRYEAFLKADEEQSEEYKEIFEFSKDFYKWMYEKDDNSSLYESMDLYYADFYHEIVWTIGDMMEGGYSGIKMFINDNRNMIDWLDEKGTFREDIREGLDLFEKKVNELEQNYSKKQSRRKSMMH